MVYTANWGIIWYLPPIKGNQKPPLIWFSVSCFEITPPPCCCFDRSFNVFSPAWVWRSDLKMGELFGGKMLLFFLGGDGFGDVFFVWFLAVVGKMFTYIYIYVTCLYFYLDLLHISHSVFIDMYICTFICIHIYICRYVHIYIYICIWTYFYIYMYVNIFTYLFIYQ